ncbi:MAG: PaaI family thioesterase [Candidatus Sumerlaeia bacterium]
MTERIKHFLEEHDQMARHLQIELLEVGEGRATARMTIRPFHLNSVGVVQGGAIFTLADYAFAAASNSHGQLALSISATITFMLAKSEGVLTAQAVEISRNPKLGVYDVKVTDEAGSLVAAFHGLVYRKKEPYGG